MFELLDQLYFGECKARSFPSHFCRRFVLLDYSWLQVSFRHSLLYTLIRRGFRSTPLSPEQVLSNKQCPFLLSSCLFCLYFGLCLDGKLLQIVAKYPFQRFEALSFASRPVAICHFHIYSIILFSMGLNMSRFLLSVIFFYHRTEFSAPIIFFSLLILSSTSRSPIPSQVHAHKFSRSPLTHMHFVYFHLQLVSNFHTPLSVFVSYILDLLCHVLELLDHQRSVGYIVYIFYASSGVHVKGIF